MRVKYKTVVSTHGGNSSALACRAVIACKGFGAFVDTAKIIETGWFQASTLEGM
jgi:hypothetical protein